MVAAEAPSRTITPYRTGVSEAVPVGSVPMKSPATVSFVEAAPAMRMP
jgi:hypothetical protein